ncbi:MAG: alpha-hydroxy-acid oxidizing protein [Proteobacteria bacterium]|nr:alpha-hydroxy-acid oxidizing protein [Pseudomonadota bacterium]
MRKTPDPLTRRALLGTIAALPAAAALPLPPSQAFRRAVPPPASAGEVLDVMGFEPLAREALPPAHFGYLATGADDDRTVLRNQDAFGDIEIRARRFVDVSHVDTRVALYGTRYAGPVYLSAVSSQRAFHPDAELAVARAARSRDAPLMISSGSSVPTDAVAAERGAPVWQQLYPTDDWEVTRALVRRIEEAGCPAIVLTVDTMPGRNNETLRRAMAADSRTCTDCHVNNNHDMWRKAPLYAGLDVSRVTTHLPMDLTPAYLDRLRALVKVKLLVKGIVAGEDAALAVEHGADGVIVSNHGGRNEETLRATIDCLPEIAAAVRGRVPVLLDGGVRRGTDVFKALALGATAVGIGRPQGWGLAAFGQSGVEAVLDLYVRELTQIMRQAGTPTLADIRPERVNRRGVR